MCSPTGAMTFPRLTIKDQKWVLAQFLEISAPSLVAQPVRNPPAMWETWVRFLGWEDPLEKEMTIPTPVLLPGKSHGQKNLVGYSPWGRKIKTQQ